ncbi:MAG: MFS transporter [Solirubrobacterales bacterium]|nr:MFS transporter [Solirubrobacterales bacterium]
MAPLRHRGFRLLAAGQLISIIGDLFYAVALPWYVLANHGGALLLGTVLAAYGIPRTVGMAVGGSLADRFRPWNVMMGSDALRAVLVAALAVVAGAGPAHPGLLIPLAAVLGTAAGVFVPSTMSVVPALLPDEELQAGNALQMSAEQLANLLGPIVGGVVVALVGPAAAFGIDAASFFVSAATLIGIRVHQNQVACEIRDVEAAASFAKLLRSERGLQVAIVVVIAANLGMGGLSEVALPVLAHGNFHAGADGYGVLVAALGAGGLIGTLVSGQVRALALPAMVASGGYLISALVMALVPYLGGLIPAAGALVLFGLLNGFGNALMFTTIQRWAPRAVMGRLMGALMLSSMGVFPLSTLLGGILVHAAGAAVMFPAASALLALAVLSGMTQPAWRQLGAASPAF